MNENTKENTPEDAKEQAHQEVKAGPEAVADYKIMLQKCMINLEKLRNTMPEKAKQDPKFVELTEIFEGDMEENVNKYIDQKTQVYKTENPDLHRLTYKMLAMRELNGLAESAGLQEKFDAYEKRLVEMKEAKK